MILAWLLISTRCVWNNQSPQVKIVAGEGSIVSEEYIPQGAINVIRMAADVFGREAGHRR